jgi:hypothetical protein
MFDPNDRPSGRVGSDPRFALFNLPGASGVDVMGNPVVPPGSFGMGPIPAADHFVLPGGMPAAQSGPHGELAPDTGAGGASGSPLGAINAIAPLARRPNSLLGYADPATNAWPALPSAGSSQGPLGYATPFGPQTGNLHGFGSPAGAGNLPPLSDFESQMARVPSMFIPKYVAATHHVPVPPNLPMSAESGVHWDGQQYVLGDPASSDGQAQGQPDASPLGPDYLLDKIPPPLPASAAPPLPTLQDPDAIRAILVPALRAAAQQRAQAALQAPPGTDVISRLASNGW